MSVGPDPWIATLVRDLQLREAVASVSLSHAEHCDCVMCRAANGDEAALREMRELVDP